MKHNIDENINQLTNHLFREHYGKMVSYLSQKYGYQEIENILDAVQESFETALRAWKFSEIPNNPFAWLYKVANNKLINKIKQNHTAKVYIGHLPVSEDVFEEYKEQDAEDGLLKLLLFFSKADFSERNKIIISLYFLCGFGYTEISNALFLKVETIKKIILRSKIAIQEFAKKYDNFKIENSDKDLEHLLKIIYLMFNEGYKSSQQNGTINSEVCYEAIRLGKLINKYYQGNTETNSLLALLFFNASRFPARIENDIWVTLESQNRELWDKQLISEGFYYLKKARSKECQLNKYYLEALVSSLHCTSKTYELTDWKTIVFIYRQLEIIEPGSVLIQLNRIIAESNYECIEKLMKEVNSIENHTNEELLFTLFMTKAHFYVKLHKFNKAINCYLQSVNYSKNKIDKNYIAQRIVHLKKVATT